MTAPPEPSPFERGDLTAEEYAGFIGQIELREIWLRSAQVANHHGPAAPERVAIGVDSTASCEALPGGFRAVHTYRLRADSGETPGLEIEVSFALDFDSKQPMTDPIFEVFAEYNLPVNSWPYLREYVATTVGRMGWLPFTLPALKRGTRPLSRNGGDPTASPQGTARTSTSRSRKAPKGRKTATEQGEPGA
ncbi:MAG TPA: hypothetical protein VH482_08360 [Thermomicrobiales bacterium]